MKCNTRSRSSPDTKAPDAFPGAITLSACMKATIVTTLAWLIAWRPGIAIRLGKLVLRVWPNFRRA
jgi:hypothetical protein